MYYVLDISTSPQLVVSTETTEADAHAMADKYAAQTGHTTVVCRVMVKKN